ncbi:MAG: hypothetical protein CLLPBCKN_001347 [Chroococcidiopsis cubana SAG 39.79]|uniref:Uncharacterized protein n=1 Tax=Chroococcidiopsis cubana SAG 39.79 TaxID=388085 RepID=A0AB37UCV1_9CYAN|nr:hypothetical protein [Chroococcidiopsis cubana]MDZ4871959.1 hypothetical protein [Chroococcidiopsis cubana SAG 39.79]PSB64930.1 hypothetical protein C7B79_07585 [Chroococcidiopsis cubana CCALA 043]RUT05376.1 hypothetical protein DSM107010_55290 [Chroococcidiopsis cubana SAG 39.79]
MGLIDDMYDTARRKTECGIYDLVFLVVPGKPEFSNEDGTIRAVRVKGVEDLQSCPLNFRHEQVKKLTAPSDDEIDKRVEGLVDLYKRNAEAFNRDFNMTHIDRSMHFKPFTEQEKLTLLILEIAAVHARTEGSERFTVDSLHVCLVESLGDYSHPKARTYRALERGVKCGLFDKSKVKSRVQYSLSDSAKNTYTDIMSEMIVTYLRAVTSLKIGTTKVPSLTAESALDMLFEATTKMVKFYICGHY